MAMMLSRRVSTSVSIWSRVSVSGGESTFMWPKRAHQQAALLAVAGDAGADLGVGLEDLLGLLVLHRLDAHHELVAPHVADQRQRQELVEPLLEVRADLAHVAAQVLALHDLDVLERGRAGDRVPGVGEAVGEERAVGLRHADDLVDIVGEERRRVWDVARSEPLGRGDDVRRDAEHGLGGEEVPEPAEAGHHLVRDVEHPVLFAHRLGAGVVAGRGHDHPAAAHDRLGDEAGHVLRPQLQDLVLEVGDLLVAEVVHAHAVRAAVGVGRRDVVHQVGREIEAVMVELHPGHGHREVGRAVIGVDARDDLLLRPLAEPVEVEVDDADGGVVRHRPAGAVEDVVDGGGRKLGELRRKLRRRRRGQVRKR